MDAQYHQLRKKFRERSSLKIKENIFGGYKLIVASKP